MHEVKYEGGCHCGRVRFRVRVKRHHALECNCSICKKKGFIHLIVPPEDFDLLCGADELTIYEFGTCIAKHKFCRHCGIHAFYTPRSHPDHVDVNVRCLDGAALSKFAVSSFDGRNWGRAARALHP
jgi:hypothetical protein